MDMAAAEFERVIALPGIVGAHIPGNAFLTYEAAERVRPVLGVRRAYLEAAFDEIREGYGDFDSYLRDALDVDDAERARLAELLLE